MIPALVVVGYGHVGRRFVRLLEETADTLAGLGIHPRIVAVATRRHGAIADVQGLDQARIDAALAGTTPSETASSASFITDVVARVRERGDLVPMVVEITTLDIERGEPAISHVRAALAAGAHVISAIVGRNAIPTEDYDDVVFGCVDTIGALAGDIARTAWLAAGMPLCVPGTTF